LIAKSHVDDITKIMKENPGALQKLTYQLKEHSEQLSAQKKILASVFNFSHHFRLILIMIFVFRTNSKDIV